MPLCPQNIHPRSLRYYKYNILLESLREFVQDRNYLELMYLKRLCNLTNPDLKKITGYSDRTIAEILNRKQDISDEKFKEFKEYIAEHYQAESLFAQIDFESHLKSLCKPTERGFVTLEENK